MAYARKRLSLVEYGSPVEVVQKIAAAIGIGRAEAKAMLMDAGNRAALSLGLGYNPISVSEKGARATDFAGLIRLAPSLELEVAPKFLGLDEFDARWREDFFFLSTLSRHGRLLASERLLASGGTPRDLATLVARSLTGMYADLKRRPLRSYRRVREVDFYIDGDPDPVDLVLPSSEGFEQEVIRFDRWNSWNADIMGAAKALLPEVRDPTVVGSLVRLIEELSPQRGATSRRRPIPSRHQAWQPLHSLSLDVLDGLGLSYQQGRAHAPGYLVTTWRVWEDLLTVAARLGFGASVVMSQKGFLLGTKTRLGTGAVTPVSVYPDCVIESDGLRPRILLDAKYKGHVEKGRLRISESDVYEALAFAKAAAATKVVLAYPAQPRGALQETGACTIFERVQVDAVQIVGMQIEVRGISSRGALKRFSSFLVDAVSHAFIY